MKTGFRKIGLLASPKTIDSKIHTQLFNKREVIILNSEGRCKTRDLIQAVISGKKDQTPLLQDQINQLLLLGSEIVILGCTELSVLNHKTPLKNVIDPLNIICDKIMGHEV